MTNPLFQQLAEKEIPPVPTGLDGQVHQRLNSMLLTTHLLELVWHALPYVLGVFMGSVLFLIEFTTTGRLNQKSDRQQENNE